MIVNYHTHTARCGHAWGSDREYAESALAAGLKILGFSDHTPYDFFDSEPRNRPMRMRPEELPGYAVTLGIRDLTRAKKILLLAFGEEKAAAVFQMLYAKTTSYVPAAYLQIPLEVTVLLDGAAAAKL